MGNVGKILVIDPSLLDRKRMRGILEAAGHTVVETCSPAEAMGFLRSADGGAIHLILTELDFPQGTLLEFVRWLKGEERLKWVPIVVVTPQPPRDVVIEMVAAGAYTIVTKPFGPDMLLRRVTETLAEHAPLRQGDGGNLTWPIGEYIRRELKLAERSGRTFSVVVCRLRGGADNRAVPHLMGGLVQIMRESDVLARLGDDQVVILLPDTDAAGARVVEERIAQVARKLSEERPEGITLPVEVSTGIANYPAEASDGHHLLRLAGERSIT